MKRRKHNEGFTLAELLIVIALIAIFAAVAIPVVQSALGIDTHSSGYHAGFPNSSYVWG